MNKVSQKIHNKRPSCLDSVLIDTDQIAIRLAEGESWSNSAMGLAMLVTSDGYRQKMPGRIQQCQYDCHDKGTAPMLMRRNSFQPDFEPNRHEMRIFDDLDGIVTEM